MHTIRDLRPTIDPVPLAALVENFGSWTLRVPGPNGQATTYADTGESGFPDIPILGSSVNSEEMEEGWAFVGIPGMRRHGASLAKRAMDHGAVLLVTDEAGWEIAREAGIPTLVVDDPRASAATVSKAIYAGAFKDRVLAGVTGTNGKTTTTYLLRAALAPKYSPMGIVGTVELDTGKTQIIADKTTHEAPVVYRTIAVGAENDMAGMVLEVSSHAMSLNRVDGIKFDLAVFTNLQHDHLDFYEGSMDLYFEAKAAMFTPGSARVGVTGVDDLYGRRLLKEAKIPMTAVQVFTDDDVDTGGAPLWRASDIHTEAGTWGTYFTLTDPSGNGYQALCPMPGLVNVQNAALAVVSAQVLGVPAEEAIAALAKAPSVPGRMQAFPRLGSHQPSVVVDYAHTPEAIEQLLIDFKAVTEGNLVAVFGTDGDRDATKRDPLAQIVARRADVLWVTDENPRFEDAASIRSQLLGGIKKVRPDMEGVVEVTTSRRDAIRDAILDSGPADTVIIFGKGAERYQDIRGVKHKYLDADVAQEVLEQTTVA